VNSCAGFLELPLWDKSQEATLTIPDLPPEENPELKEPSESEEDDGLILWMLSLTPTQRLEVAQGFIDSIRILRNGRRA
jgi:hypothetical protein